MIRLHLHTKSIKLSTKDEIHAIQLNYNGRYEQGIKEKKRQETCGKGETGESERFYELLQNSKFSKNLCDLLQINLCTVSLKICEIAEVTVTFSAFMLSILIRTYHKRDTNYFPTIS